MKVTDHKDFGILAALHSDARQSYASLGRKVGLTAPAVRKRVHRLSASGVLTGYGLWVDPSVFGRREVLLPFPRERTREEVIKILDMKDVSYVGWKLEGGVTVATWTDDPTSSRVATEKAMGERAMSEVSSALRGNPRLGELDATIIDALADDPVVPFEEIVHRTGLSPKTVRKHLKVLVESETIIIQPEVGVRPGSGELVCHIKVMGDVRFGAIVKVLGDAILLNETLEPRAMFILCRGDGIGDVTTKMKALRRVPGVTQVILSMNREIIFNPALVHRLVRDRLAKLGYGLRVAPLPHVGPNLTVRG